MSKHGKNNEVSRGIPNAETREALREVEEMKKDPLLGNPILTLMR